MNTRVKVAILDDYQNVALSMADWTPVTQRADITVFNDHVTDPDLLVDRLAPFDVVFVMRERTPLPREVIERLPHLKMIASTGPFNASIDMEATADHGIHVGTTGGTIASTVELTWVLILAASRNLVGENSAVRAGGWQTSVGRELAGRVLGGVGCRPHRQAGRTGRYRVWHEGHHLEPEPQRGRGGGSQRNLRHQGGTVQQIGSADHPSEVERALAKPGR